MQRSNRVLVIGLDGASWDVLDPWIRDGSLPNLAKLRQRGSWGPLRSSIPPLTAAAWSSFMTGKRPGKHGVFHFIDLFSDTEAAKGEPKIVNARSLKSPMLWDILGSHDRKVGLINIPMTYPPRPVNGVMVTCFLTPRNAATFTYPYELSKELTDYIIDLDRFIDVKPYEGGRDKKSIAPTISLMQEFRDMTDKRAKTTLSLMGSQPWDFFMVVFISTDRMGHYLWPYHRSADRKDIPEVQALCHAVHEHYIRLDQIVGSLVEKAGEDVTVMIMSDHGMGARYTKRVHWNSWLNQKGWLSAKNNNGRISDPDSWLQRLGLPRDKIRQIVLNIPGLMGSKVVKRAVKNDPVTVDVSQSKAYCVPIYDTITGVRINLEGVEKEVLTQQIMQELTSIVDPETGEGVVQEVYRGEEYYSGPYAENIPDLIVCLKPNYGCGYRLRHYSSIVTKIQAIPGRGNHRLDGIFIANGSDVLSNPDPLVNLEIEDIAPTVLHLMGLPVPSDMDGRVLTEIVLPESLRSYPVRYGDPTGFWPNKNAPAFYDEAISDEDEGEIRARLQALGYI